MTLFETIRSLQTIAGTNPYINSVGDGSIYDFMNANPSIKYGVFFVSQTTHRENEYFDWYGFNLFVIDRLIDDLDGNRLQVQSIAKEVLSNTIKTLCSKYLGITHNEIKYVPFTQRFTDECAGQYATLELKVPKTIICEEDFKDLVIYTGNCKECYDEGYKDGLSATFEEGFESGRTYQKSLLISTVITENGTYEREDGYLNITVAVDVDKYFNSGYTSGYTDGYEEGYSEGYDDGLIDCGKDYDEGYDDGYSDGFVSGYSSGYTDGYEDGLEDCGKDYEEGFEDGFESGYTSGLTVGYDSGYTKGYEDGLNDCSGTTYYIDTDVDEVEADNDGGEFNINIYSNCDWEVIASDWITVVPISGYGNDSINVVISETDVDRDGYIILSGNNVSKRIDVRQNVLDYEDEYFTIRVLNVIGDGNIVLSDTGTTSHPVSIKINDDDWIELDSFNYSYSPEIGDTIKIKGINGSCEGCNIGTDSNYVYFDVYGNIMSLLYGDEFENQTTLESIYTFNYLFYSLYPTLLDAKNLILPATTLAERCYSNMFNGCRSLVNAPALPATTLEYQCYAYMFQNCSSLVNAPELPSTTLAERCYYYMFQNCSSLVSAPALPATTLASDCYRDMFAGCTSLTTAPELPATALTTTCYQEMFMRCTSLTTAPVLPATTLERSCYYQMFNGCSSLNYIKCLATDISASNCTLYWVSNVAPTGTFVKADSMTGWTIDSVHGVPIGWTLINESDEHPDMSKEFMTFDVVSGGTIKWVASDTSFTKTIEYSINDGNWTSITSTTGGTAINVNSGDKVRIRGNNDAYCSTAHYNHFTTNFEFNVYGNIMSLIYGDNFKNQYTLTEQHALCSLFYGCSHLISAENLVLPATTLAPNCYQAMFYDCSGLTTAPALPATILAEMCYQNMFRNCYSLTTAPELPATTLATNCYRDMFYNCTSLNYIKCLATDISATNCTSNWVYGVASTGTFVKNPSMTSWTRGNNGIPNNWTIVDAS